jgi:diaminopimelate decarboxylase
VASLGEINAVRAIDATVPIIFGGPGKTDAELEGALCQGVSLFNIESEHQLRRLDWIAARLDRMADVLLRVNPDHVPHRATLRMGGQATQFGIEESAVPQVLALAGELRRIRVRGIHIHAISNNLDAASHLELVRQYLNMAHSFERARQLEFHWLDVGGGIGVNYDDPAQEFDWSGFCLGLGAMLKSRQQGPELIFECGRFITADCGYYLAEVTDIKTTHGQTFVVLRGGTHHFRLPASWQHSHPFVILPRPTWPYPFARPTIIDTPVTICGELCTPKDTLARAVPVPLLRAGDCVAFVLAGAYGWHVSHHDFLSHPHPERVYVSE